MNARLISTYLLVSGIGVCAGWFANTFSEQEIRKAQGALALVDANNAAKSGELDKAIEYAQYVILLDKNSPSADLADNQIKEWAKRRIEKISACK